MGVKLQYSKENDRIVYYSQEVSDHDIIGDTNFMPILSKEFGYRILRGSAAGLKDKKEYEELFRRILESISFKTAVEIGTWRGVSSAFLAHYGEKVITLDIRYYDEAVRVWMYAGVNDKICYITIKDNKNKKNIIDQIEFDFAFIDGMHTYEDVKYDFECVKKCGQVLFHDYHDDCPGIKKFVDELPEDEVEIIDMFALWKQHK